jgi:uncharacterized Zn-finger protein
VPQLSNQLGRQLSNSLGQTHKRCHTDEKPFACGVCGRLFKQRGNVKPHIINVHERKNKPVCNFPGCGKSFTTIGNMKVGAKLQHGWSTPPPFT